LPTQIETNLQGVQNRQLQIQAILDTVDRDQERRLAIDRQVTELENAVDPVSTQPITTDNGTTAQRLAAARATLTQLQLTLKPDHPDVKRLNATVRDLERKLEVEAREAPISAEPAASPREKRIADLKAQLEQLDKQTARNLQEVEQLRKDAAEYQRRAESGPTRETEMVELNRDYNTLQGMYTSLLGRKEEASIAANLERRQIGEQFKLLDAARLPERPFSPDRRRLNLMGMAAGLAIGLALVALLEYRDVSLHSDDELTRVLTLPVLAVVPLMESGPEHRRRLKYRVALGLGLGGTVLGCFAIIIYTFIR
jgi:uncharacterized protein involved in exopolysaccharide biosynthesis